MNTNFTWSRNIIIQAGGKGSRLGHLTANRPKCLVPVENRPMLFHIFEQFPDARFIIIGDTHYDVLEKYLKAFAKVNYTPVKATGRAGTLAGVAAALKLLPPAEPFMVVWSDLILPQPLQFPEAMANYIGIGVDLPCRWSFANGEIVEIPSSAAGIAGIFLFQDQKPLADAPWSGQFVKFLASRASQFLPWRITGLREFGLLSEYERLPIPKCRSFNALEVRHDKLIKRPLTEQGRNLARREIAWYKYAAGRGLPIPQIYGYDPLCMENVDGATIADCETGTATEKLAILNKIMAALSKLHAQGGCPFAAASHADAYLRKTRARLEQVRELVPFAREEIIHINGRPCRNPLSHLEAACALIAPPATFCLIHGDPTFSNILLRASGEICFIDPRGYFGKTELFGDPAYDYAKLYYSLCGNYDQFNKKQFRLAICENGARLFIASTGFECCAASFFAQLPDGMTKFQIKLIHAIIWLSLTTYTWEDYDAICAAFYHGALLLEEALSEQNP